MEDLILKIIDIEERAQELVKDAKDADAHFDDTLKAEEKDLHDKIMTETEEKRRRMLEDEEKKLEERKQSIRENAELRTEELRKTYEHSKEEWVNRMFKNIIG